MRLSAYCLFILGFPVWFGLAAAWGASGPQCIGYLALLHKLCRQIRLEVRVAGKSAGRYPRQHALRGQNAGVVSIQQGLKLRSYSTHVLASAFQPARTDFAIGHAVHFVNPLEHDGFFEPGGWGSHAVSESLPLLVFLPGMDGSIVTPFWQYPQLGTQFELACMVHTAGMNSRAPFEQLVEEVVQYMSSARRAGRRVLLVGESFGGTLALAVAQRLDAESSGAPAPLLGLALINAATCYASSALSVVGPVCASLRGPFYCASLLLLAALVLEPRTQLPGMLSLLTSRCLPSLLATPEREAYLVRVALSAFLGLKEPGLQIGQLFRVAVFSRSDLEFRLSQWLETGAREVERHGLSSLRVPTVVVAGEYDRLLPSVAEAERLASLLPDCRGTVTVPGAGHASTLGAAIDLSALLSTAFAPELASGADTCAVGKSNVFDMPENLEQVAIPPRAANEGPWAHGFIPRPYPPLKVEACVTYNRWSEAAGSI